MKMTKKITNKVKQLATAATISIEIKDARVRQNSDLYPEMEAKLKQVTEIYSIKMGLVKLQMFDAASEVRKKENILVEEIKYLATLLKTYPIK